MVEASAMRTGSYICDYCDKIIMICDRCGSDLEAHDGFDEDGDAITCARGKHVVPGCKMKKARRW